MVHSKLDYRFPIDQGDQWFSTYNDLNFQLRSLCVTMKIIIWCEMENLKLDFKTIKKFWMDLIFIVNIDNGF